jgi:hypothetical protein
MEEMIRCSSKKLIEVHLTAEMDVSLMASHRHNLGIYETIILPVVLYGHETWSLTLREEHRLRRIFGTKMNEVTGG